MTSSVVQVAALVFAAVVLRALWGLGRWFVSRPESIGGWIARAGLAWVLARSLGVA